LTVFFDCRGVVHKEFLPPSQTVNKKYYLAVRHRLRESVRQKGPELWRNNSWILHHDNAPAHTSMLVRKFLTKNSTNIIPQARIRLIRHRATFFCSTTQITNARNPF
jgi:hypothetical protein